MDLVAETDDPVLMPFVRVQNGSVSGAAVIDQRISLVHAVFEIFGAVHRQNGRQLFARERFGGGNVFNFGDQDFCVFRNTDSRDFRDFNGRLSDDGGIEFIVREHRGFPLFAYAPR